MSRLVTLTTDWNNSDYYIGVVKAGILAKNSEVVFVDISHNIEHYNWQQAAFVLRSVVDDFPEGTIHIVGVGSEPDDGQKIVVAVYKKQYFICTDNGTLGIVFKEKPEKVFALDLGFGNFCFIEKNVFVPLANRIIAGRDLQDIDGIEIKADVLRYTESLPVVSERNIVGSIVYIDSYGNAITNISRELFEDVVGDGDFEILLNSAKHKTSQIFDSYKEVAASEIVCLFNSLELLEVAVCCGSAKNLLGLRYDSKIRIDIK